MSRLDSDSNEGLYERCGMRMCANEVVWTGGMGKKEYS